VRVAGGRATAIAIAIKTARGLLWVRRRLELECGVETKTHSPPGLYILIGPLRMLQ
jgi:hypothetical protein